MPEPKQVDWSLDDFLVWEAAQADRYELVDGEPRLMTGGTVEQVYDACASVDGEPRLMTGGTQAHTAICINITSLSRRKLRDTPCRPGGSDLRVPIPVTGQSRYPDALIDCGKFDPSAHDATEPTVVFEVLSKSNDLRDQYGRLRDYDSVPTIRHYVVVAQSEPVVVVYDRDEAGRLAPGSMITKPDAELLLPRVGIGLALAAIYEGLGLLPEDAA